MFSAYRGLKNIIFDIIFPIFPRSDSDFSGAQKKTIISQKCARDFQYGIIFFKAMQKSTNPHTKQADFKLFLRNIENVCRFESHAHKFSLFIE
jgi:hypothetical protein